MSKEARCNFCGKLLEGTTVLAWRGGLYDHKECVRHQAAVYSIDEEIVTNALQAETEEVASADLKDANIPKVATAECVIHVPFLSAITLLQANDVDLNIPEWTPEFVTEDYEIEVATPLGYMTQKLGDLIDFKLAFRIHSN